MLRGDEPAYRLIVWRINALGDMPYEEHSLYGSLVDMNPRLELLVYSPAATALDFAAHALPLFTPPVLVHDTAPLMHPIYPKDTALLRGRRGNASFAALGALALIASLGVLIRRRDVVYAKVCYVANEGAIPAIEVRVASKRYGKATALEGAEFEVGSGEAVVLWGPNGSDKTTLIRCMLGTVQFEGQVVRHGTFGYVPQQLPTFDMRACELAAFVGALHGVTKKSCDDALREAGLSNAREQSVAELSGGQRQRLSVAIASLGSPNILFLDEPTVGLDFDSKRRILRHLREAQARGITIVIATHNPEDVMEIADRVAIMSGGRVVKLVSIEEFASMIERQREIAS